MTRNYSQTGKNAEPAAIYFEPNTPASRRVFMKFPDGTSPTGSRMFSATVEIVGKVFINYLSKLEIPVNPVFTEGFDATMREYFSGIASKHNRQFG